MRIEGANIPRQLCTHSNIDWRTGKDRGQCLLGNQTVLCIPHKSPLNELSSYLEVVISKLTKYGDVALK